MTDDVRVWVGVIAVIGIVLGNVLSLARLEYLSAFMLGFLIVFLWRINKKYGGNGTSGALGFSVVTIIYTLCLVVPAWITHWLK